MKNIVKNIILIEQNGMDEDGNLWDSAEDYLAEKIYDMLMNPEFYDWYTNEHGLTMENILIDIKNFLK